VLDDLNERRDYITEALKRLPGYATELGEVVGSGPGFNVNVYGVIPAPLLATMFDFVYQPGKMPASFADYLRGLIQETLGPLGRSPHDRAGFRQPRLRNITIAALVAVLIAAPMCLFSAAGGGRKIVGYFASAVGIYPGDQGRILGVPVGSIDSIEPRASDVRSPCRSPGT